jgi:hypothetical protein
MAITTRARMSVFLAVAALLVAGIAGTQGVGARSQRPVADGSEPGSGGGRDAVSGICVAPDAPDGAASGPPPFLEECEDTIDDPVVVDPDGCGENVTGTGPDAAVGYTPCPGDDDSVVHDVDDGAQLVEPTPGMADVRPHVFDHAAVNANGTSLTVFFWSGVEPCYVLDHVDVDESPTTIIVTLFEGRDASAGDVACIEIALLKKVVVQLDAPVGDRRIVDGAA